MGTRSLIKVKNSNDDILVSIYQQFDGYPSGVGQDLLDMFKGHKIINGITVRDDNSKKHNGLSCFAATLVHKLKNSIGGTYLYPVDSEGDWIEYEYVITEKDRRLFLNLNDGLYIGFLDDFKAKDCL